MFFGACHQQIFVLENVEQQISVCESVRRSTNSLNRYRFYNYLVLHRKCSIILAYREKMLSELQNNSVLIQNTVLSTDSVIRNGCTENRFKNLIIPYISVGKRDNIRDSLTTPFTVVAKLPPPPG